MDTITVDAVHRTGYGPNSASILVPQITKDVLQDLDPRYYTQSFDPIQYTLERVPQSRTQLDDFFVVELCAVDDAKDVIRKKLAQQVHQNAASLIEGMNLVQKVDIEVLQTLIHVKNGRRLLASANEKCIVSMLRSIRIRQKRRRMEEIFAYVQEIRNCFEKETLMREALTKSQFMAAVEICFDLRDTLAIDHLQNVSILNNLNNRTHDFVSVLKEQFELSLGKTAEAFEPRTYRELLQGYITLADHAEDLGLDFTSESLCEILSSIPESLIRWIHMITKKEMNRLWQSLRHEQSKNTASMATKYETKTHPQLGSDEYGLRPGFERTDPTTASTVSKLVNAYEQLTNLIYSYYLLVQWHRDPFNPRNDSMEYLHRCGMEDDDDDDDEEDHETVEDKFHSEEKEQGRRISNGSQHTYSLQEILTTATSSGACYNQKLCEIGMELLRYRKVVWEFMQQMVGEYLDHLYIHSKYTLAQIVVISKCTTKFLEIGEEFTGVPCARLRSTVHLKCEQYLSSLHAENIELMRMLLDTESWRKVDCEFTQIGTSDLTIPGSEEWLHHLIEQRSHLRLHPYDMSHAPTSNAIHERHVLPSFHKYGNPFHSMSSASSLDICDDVSTDIDLSSANLMDCASPVEVKHQNIQHEELILNTSTLSGFCRLFGIYLKIMEKLPQVAWDAFLHLNKLFELQFLYVFTAFSSPDNVKSLFDHRTFSDKVCQLRQMVYRLGKNDSFEEKKVFCTVSIPLKLVQNRTEKCYNNQRVPLVFHLLACAPVCMEHANENNMFAIAEKSVAIEGLRSQLKMLQTMEPWIRSYLGTRHSTICREIYSRNEKASSQLRDYLYIITIHKLCQDVRILEAINNINWDLSFVTKQSNAYIVEIVRRCGEIFGGLQVVGDGALPSYTRDQIWSHLVQFVFQMLLDGFSQATKCTLQGRALMMMDLQALLKGLDLVHHVEQRVSKYARVYINDYLKAFFFFEQDLIQWIRDHKEHYSKRHIVSLIANGIGASLDRNDFEKLIAKIDHAIANKSSP